MAKEAPRKPQNARVNAIVGLDTAARLDAARAALKKQGIWVSMSMFVEIALKELLDKDPEKAKVKTKLAEVMRKHKAKARRD